MKRDEPKQIMYTSDEAAKEVTVTGWVSSGGIFYGKNEHVARYAGCTHRICESCHSVVSKLYVRCDDCQLKIETDKYHAMPFKEYDGGMIYSDATDRYFHDESGVIDHCEQENCTSESLRLVICEPVIAEEIDHELWGSDLPEDTYLDDVAHELCDAVEVVNKLIRDQRPILSYRPGKFRTGIKVEIEGGKQEEEMTEYKSMDTAPKDGTVIRLMNSQMLRPVLGHWGKLIAGANGKTYTNWVSDSTPASGEYEFSFPAGRLICPDKWAPVE